MSNVKAVSLQILKSDDTKRLVYGIVLVPEVADAHGDIMEQAEVTKSAHNYLMYYRNAGVEHKDLADAVVAESYIVPEDIQAYGKQLKKGTWVIALKVFDDILWNKVRSGDYKGFSAGGYARREQTKEA